MRSKVFSFVVSVAVLAAACGRSTSPTSPSTSAASPASGMATNGATISGTVAGMATASRIRAMSAGMTVSVAGSSTSTSVDSSGHFLLQNVPAGNVTLQFSGTGVNANLTLSNVAPNSMVTISVHVSGNTAQLDTDETETPDNEAEVEGIVTAIGKNTLTVAGKMVTVTSSTKITHGETTLTFADIHMGDRVHVEGTSSGTGSSATITAKTIEDQDGVATPGDGGDKNPNDGGPNNGSPQTGNQVELSGSVSGRTGTCPALTFTVSSTKVTTSSNTQFKDVTCSTVANGMSVEVKGTKQTDGSVAASSVEKQ